MTYSEAIQFLFDLRLFGAKFGLSNTFKLAQLAGNPQDSLRFIHVAGTNGKGSTCAMLESIYRAAGLRVGLFTSPHLIAFGERIQVNRQMISQADILRAVESLRTFLKEFSGSESPTFFEFVTVMALCYFATQKCDLVIWETGLGGRLDATNIVTPLASVITNVQYDHEEWLGHTLSLIAFEKAGIIKRGVPVLTAAREPEALRVIEETAQNQKADFTRVHDIDVSMPPLNRIDLTLPGKHQRLNAALAISTVHTLAAQIPVTEKALTEGLSTVNWPGRFQLITNSSGRKILLDGAHNPAGTEALAAAWQERFGEVKPVLVLGILKDKNVESISRILTPLASRVLLVPVSSLRSAKPEEVQAAIHRANPSAQTLVCDSVAEALQITAREKFVLVTGSLYLVGEALELLQQPTHQGLCERSLNEWTTKN